MGTSHRIHQAVARVRATNSRAGRVGEDPTHFFGSPHVVVQPIIAVSTGTALAVEALARFPGGRNTEAVFTSAYGAGFGPSLEATCLRAAFRTRADLPDDVLLTVNVSPNALQHAADVDVWPVDLRGVIVEITERDVSSALDLADHLDDLRSRGAAIAVDDVSTGYAGLLRLAQLQPDYVKIDRQVVTGVAASPSQAAVLEALVTLSHRLGAAVIGEGIETLADLQAVGEFDVDYAQGHAIGRPAAQFTGVSPAVVAACRSGRERVIRGWSPAGHAAAQTRDVYAVTAALAGADRRHDIDAAITATAADLGVDVIGVSVLTAGERLREIAATGDTLDPCEYQLERYPATRLVMLEGGAVEVQVSDPDSDPAERAILRSHGFASLLLVPLHDGDDAIGVLEFAHRTPKRWTVYDVAHAQGLAQHLSPVLRRLGITDELAGIRRAAAAEARAASPSTR